jgi:hypothetical protein
VERVGLEGSAKEEGRGVVELTTLDAEEAEREEGDKLGRVFEGLAAAWTSRECGVGVGRARL